MAAPAGPGRPSLLPAALNAVFGLRLADFAEARAWLVDGGWERLEAWLAAHRNDADGTAAITEETS